MGRSTSAQNCSSNDEVHEGQERHVQWSGVYAQEASDPHRAYRYIAEEARRRQRRVRSGGRGWERNGCKSSMRLQLRTPSIPTQGKSFGRSCNLLSNKIAKNSGQ